MEEFNYKLYSTINFIKERKIADSLKTKYLTEIDEIKNSKLDNILLIKTYINRLDDIQRLAIINEQPIQIIEESTNYLFKYTDPPSIVPPPPAIVPPPPAIVPPPPAIVPPASPRLNLIDNEVKILRHEFGNFVINLAGIIKNSHVDSYFSPSNTGYSQDTINAMVPDPSNINYFLKRLATDKQFHVDSKGIFDFNDFLSEVKNAFEELSSKYTTAENELKKNNDDHKIAIDMLKNEVYELRKAYSDILIELRNRLETDEQLSDQQSTPFTDTEIKSFNSDPNSVDYIINKLVGQDDDKGEKRIKSIGISVNKKYYLDLIEGIKTRRFAKIFYVFWGEVSAYYTSRNTVHDIRLQDIGQIFKNINHFINEKGIVKDFTGDGNVKRDVYRIAHYLINNNGLPGLPNIYRLGSKIHRTDGYFSGDIAEKFSPDYIQGRSDAPYVKSDSTIGVKPFTDITLDDVINLMQLLVYGISQKKGQMVSGELKAEKFVNNFFTWKSLEPMLGGQLKIQPISFVNNILFVFIIIIFIYFMYLIYNRNTYNSTSFIYKNREGLLTDQ